jgi:NADH-quinone oxidoreductase subunit N
LKLDGIARLVLAPGANWYAIALAAFLAFGGFGYKMAAVPMQFWAPDVYQGAPTPVTAWLSVTSKAAGIAVFIRFVDSLGLGGAAAPGGFD